jgi:hypothetical protein
MIKGLSALEHNSGSRQINEKRYKNKIIRDTRKEMIAAITPPLFRLAITFSWSSFDIDTKYHNWNSRAISYSWNQCSLGENYFIFTY